MLEIKEFLPLLIPFIIMELILYGITIRHILTHEHYKMGNRTVWIIVSTVGINIIGPLLYFSLGREDA